MNYDLGYVGKYPGYDDFVQRCADSALLLAWLEWLSSYRADIEANGGRDWLDEYLAAPLWIGLTSSTPFCAGSLLTFVMPSVDSVNRYFPMSYMVRFEPIFPEPFRVLQALAPFLEATRSSMLGLLEDPLPTTEELRGSVNTLRAGLDACLAGLEMDADLVYEVAELPGSDSRILVFEGLAEDLGKRPRFIERVLALKQPRYSIWSAFSEEYGERTFCFDALPSAAEFALIQHWAGPKHDTGEHRHRDLTGE